MSVITLAQGKGGSGKTLTGMCIAAEGVRRGYSVIAVDADSGQQFGTFINSRERLLNLTDITYRSITNRDDLIDTVQKAEDEYDIVLVDTPADLSDITVYSVGVSDVVIVPIVASANDVIQASKTIGMARSGSKLVRRDIPVHALLNRVNPQTNIFKFLKGQIDEELAVSKFETSFGNRAAFVEMLNTGELPSSGKARLEVMWLFDELIAKELVPAKPNKTEKAA